MIPLTRAHFQLIFAEKEIAAFLKKYPQRGQELCDILYAEKKLRSVDEHHTLREVLKRNSSNKTVGKYKCSQYCFFFADVITLQHLCFMYNLSKEDYKNLFCYGFTGYYVERPRTDLTIMTRIPLIVTKKYVKKFFLLAYNFTEKEFQKFAKTNDLYNWMDNRMLEHVEKNTIQFNLLNEKDIIYWKVQYELKKHGIEKRINNIKDIGNYFVEIPESLIEYYQKAITNDRKTKFNDL